MKFLDHRIPPPIVALIVAALMWGFSHLLSNPMLGNWRWPAGLGLMVLGIGLAVAGRRSFVQSGTTINPINIRAAKRLVVHGPLKFTRNPMYLGMALFLVGIAATLGQPWLLAGPIAFALYIQQFQILPEERVMLEKFGAEYEAYRSRVRRWI